MTRGCNVLASAGTHQLESAGHCSLHIPVRAELLGMECRLNSHGATLGVLPRSIVGGGLGIGANANHIQVD